MQHQPQVRTACHGLHCCYKLALVTTGSHQPPQACTMRHMLTTLHRLVAVLYGQRTHYQTQYQHQHINYQHPSRMTNYCMRSFTQVMDGLANLESPTGHTEGPAAHTI
ncbi:hypothetical protein NP493_359g01049 [Ridgeia piscesae]|uniref:Uncharacterized protein n=1 Tax=Ridgeia piscesae TaxID=27915 RepID=A0AAD9NVD1_RIDPI|nr:hypothetical protein NP493_359g01049 [Ridgeia piscesae]